MADISKEPIELIEYFSEHWYKIVQGDQVHYLPSVTTKLGIVRKDGLDRWRGDIGNREADLKMYEAANKGKREHFAFETLLKGGTVVYEPWQHSKMSSAEIQALREKSQGNIVVLRTQEEMYNLHKLKRQLDILKPEIIAVEIKVFDLHRKDAGTIDHVYKIKEGTYEIAGKTPLHLPGGIYIGDLKTGNYLDDNVWLQLAPYAYCYEKMFGVTIAGALVTHTGSTIKSGIPGLKTLARSRETLLTRDYTDYRHAAALWERNHADATPELYEIPTIITMNKELAI